jgi:hypothetical protein
MAVRAVRLIGVSLVLLLVTGTALYAQSIAGIVRDESGAVLPGVTVEVSSPALIEKTRTAVTDGAGQYRIVSLTPGVYSVEFVLPGFSSVRREGIALTGTFIATVNADMKVGALEETITVSGQSPLVDVQSVARETVFSRETLDALPTAHNVQAVAVLIPGVSPGSVSGQSGRDVGGNTKLQQPTMMFRGQAQTVQRWDTFRLTNMGPGAATSFYVNDAATQELVYSTGAGTAEVAWPGLVIDMVPKDGGNQLHGYLFSDFTYSAWSASNLNSDLEARGIRQSPKVYKISDFNPAVGGPIVRDKLWFYAAYRYEIVDNSVADSYFDANPSPYIYQEDFNRPGHDSGNVPNISIRGTWQVTGKDKFTAWYNHQARSRPFNGIGPSITPDASRNQVFNLGDPSTFRWTRAQSNRLILEGGYGQALTDYDYLYQPHITSSKDREVIQNTAIYAINEQTTGKWHGAAPGGYSNYAATVRVGRVAANYVTGSHALKAGAEFHHGVGSTGSINWFTGDLTMTFRNGLPQAVTLRIPQAIEDGYREQQYYIQDQWTLNRATINLGLRYDYHVGVVNDSVLPPSRWNPSQAFDGFEVEHWKDLSPRLGIAYDLFGTGKTALKANYARYLFPNYNEIAKQNNPQTTIGRTDTRTWTDLNRDFTIYNADGSVQSQELGPSTNNNFGKLIQSTNTTDPRTLNGWNARHTTQEWQAIVQHELAPRVAVNAGYYFRSFSNQTAVDNTLIETTDFDGPFCITAPQNADLPGGGGYPVCGLYDIKPTALGRVQNNTTFARDLGGITENYQGIEVGANVRLGASFLNFGLDLQRQLSDDCNIETAVDNPEAQFCRTVTPFRPDYKFSGAYGLPWGLQVSGTYQLSPGPQITATWQAPNSIIAPALGRNLSAGANATKTVQLMEPGKVFSDHLNQVDVRLSKSLSFGRYRVRLNANVYNLLNDAFVNSVNTTFSTSPTSQFMRPTSILLGRLFKVGAQLDF